MDEMETRNLEQEAAETQAEESVETEVQAEETAQEDAPAKTVNIFNDIMEILETGMLFVILVLFGFTYFSRPVTVDGSSMVPTLQNEDRLFMYSFLYQPHKGDIVVVDNHNNHTLDFEGNVVESDRSLKERLIKRVIALPGDVLDINAEAGTVTINGVEQDEPYINALTTTDDQAFVYPITIPEGYIFCMGDNRNHSTDSRNPLVGLISMDDVMGKTYLRYYPVDSVGVLK